MIQNIETIELPVFHGLGKVNSYLIRNAKGLFLIDTGGSNGRKILLGELVRAGYTPGSLRLVVLTHGDFDHSGNASFLHAMFGVKVAMHREDAGMVEKGDMFASRNKTKWIIRTLIPILIGFGRKERFTPGLYVDDGYDLSRYGFKASVIHLPGHSRGSIGILTAEGELFCGDLFENTKAPALNALMDDMNAAAASLQKLESMQIRTVYPGHGQPFTMAELVKGMRK